MSPTRRRAAADGLAARLARGVARVRSRTVFLLQIGVAVMLSWTLATSVLGHDQPFFAPVTALLCLGLTYGQRLRRIVEVSVGVAIGVLVGDVIVLLLGSGGWQMALVVVLAMSLGLLVSAGQLAVVQAGVQSVFIVAFASSTGEGLSRWLDALVGGAVALVIGTLAPTTPVIRPRAEAAATVRAVAATLREVAAALDRRDLDAAREALEDARSLEGRLSDLRVAAAEGVAVVRQSPFLRGSRPQAVAAHALVVPLDRCVRNLRVLARRAVAAVRRAEEVPGTYVELVGELAGVAEDLARVLDEHVRPLEARPGLARVASLARRAEPGAGLSSEIIRGQVASMVLDLLLVAGVDDDEALRLVHDAPDP